MSEPRATSAPTVPRSDRFALGPILGEGGMGVVYEALDRELGVQVALKTVRLERFRSREGTALLRFKREFRSLCDLRHPNLVALGELFGGEDGWFFTMEKIDGVDFLAWVRPGRVPISSRRGTIAGVGRSLMSRLAGSISTAHPLEADDAIAGSSADARVVVPFARRLGGTRRAPVAVDKLDLGRLRGAVIQLAEGLAALHEAGKVHRDLKPSNVLVTAAGRAVILDFGLVIDAPLSDDASIARGDAVTDLLGASGERQVLGTLEYMAPEQLTGEEIGPGADLYALGVMLFEALTARLPFEGTVEELLARKPLEEPPPPSSIEPILPRDLDEICHALLRRDPRSRPSARDVIARLERRGREPTRESAPGLRAACDRAGSSTSFVGRGRERKILHDALATSARDRKPIALFVHGASGVGKSAVAAQFRREVRATDADAFLLRGRCFGVESMPFKAFDGVVDALAGALRRLGPAARGRMIAGSDVAQIARAFPCLTALPLIADEVRAHAASVDRADRHAARERLFSCLGALFGRIAADRTFVVSIDDWQWADDDSRALLASLMRAESGPLYVITMRTPHDGPVAAHSVALPLRTLPGDVRHLVLQPLPSLDARTLAVESLRAHGQEHAPHAAVIAEAAQGHPLFIDLLCRHAPIFSPDSALPSLDEAIAASIASLSPRTHRLLEILAIARAPLSLRALTLASGDDVDAVAHEVSNLRAASIVVGTGGRAVDAIEIYHERIASVVSGRIDRQRRLQAHAQIARALAATGDAPAELIALHFVEAGRRRLAVPYAVRAADDAQRALAFDRAARLYRAALDLVPTARRGTPLESELLVKLGEALTCAGRGGDAASAFLRAAKSASPEESIELQRRAADQLLRAGHVDEGLARLRDVLSAAGLTFPSSPRRAMVSTLLERGRARLRGLEASSPSARSTSPASLAAIDAAWTAGVGLALVDPVRAIDFQSRHLRLALEAGEPSRVARALALEASLLATTGAASEARVEELRAAAEALAIETGDARAMVWAKAASATAAYMLGRWRQALAACDAAEQFAIETCTGVAWEVDAMRLFSLCALDFSGDVAALRRRVPMMFADARARGDRLAATHARIGHATTAWLIDDDPAGATRAVDGAMTELSRDASITYGDASGTVQGYYALLSRAQIDLYVGEPSRAWERIEQGWAAIRDAQLLRVQPLHIVLLHLRGRAALACAERATSGRELWLDRASRDAALIEGQKMPWSTPLAQLLAAGVARATERHDDASALLATAEAAFSAADMRVYAASARFAQSARAREPVVFELASLGVRAPEKLLAMLAPGVCSLRTDA